MHQTRRAASLISVLLEIYSSTLISAHLRSDCGMMSLYYSHFSRRIPALSKSCQCSRKSQLLSRLARNVSYSTSLHVRPNANRRSISVIGSRFSSTDTSIMPQPPPAPVQHPEIVIKDQSVTLRDDKDSVTPALPPTSVSLHADTLPISCPGCGAYAQTIDSNEPGFYSRTRKKAKQQWHKRQQAIAKEHRENSAQDGEGTEDGATSSVLDTGEIHLAEIRQVNDLTSAQKQLQKTSKTKAPTSQLQNTFNPPPNTPRSVTAVMISSTTTRVSPSLHHLSTP